MGMRKMGVVLVSGALALGMLFFGFYVGPASSMREAKAQTVPARPNFVFILTDDMRKDDLAYMPKTRSLLGGNGMSFENAFVSHPLCAPSRATIMRGQYPQNNGVWSNSSTDSSSTSIGGWEAYRQKGDEADNVATRLQDAGYRTGLFGKYMNRYDNTTYRPPGWDRWFALLFSGDPKYFDYSVNDQGIVTHYGTSDSDYLTDVLSRKTNEFIADNVAQGTPFFDYVAPIAPHQPATPAPRDAHDYDGIQGPRLPSFNEAEVSDKPSWIRQLSKLSSSQISSINTRHENQVESLQAVDDLVAGVVNTLDTTKTPDGSNALDNTYIFFTSDNGFHHGEHRVPEQKWRPYEEDRHMPLLVRRPKGCGGIDHRQAGPQHRLHAHLHGPCLLRGEPLRHAKLELRARRALAGAGAARQRGRLEERRAAGGVGQLLAALQGHPHRQYRHGPQAQVRGVQGRPEGALRPGGRPLRAEQRLQIDRTAVEPGVAPAGV